MRSLYTRALVTLHPTNWDADSIEGNTWGVTYTGYGGYRTFPIPYILSPEYNWDTAD